MRGGLRCALNVGTLCDLNISQSADVVEDYGDGKLVCDLAGCKNLRNLRICDDDLERFDVTACEGGAVFQKLEVLRLDWNRQLDIRDVRELFRRLSTRELKITELGLSDTITKIARRGFFPLRLTRRRRRRNDSDEERSTPAKSSWLFRDIGASVNILLHTLDLTGCRLHAADWHRVPKLMPSLRDLKVGASKSAARYEYPNFDVAVLLRELRLHCPGLIKLGIFRASNDHICDRLDSVELINLMQSYGEQLLELQVQGKGYDNDPFNAAPFRLVHALCPKLKLLNIKNLYEATRETGCRFMNEDTSRDDYWAWLSRQMPSCTIQAISGRTFVAGRLMDVETNFYRGSTGWKRDRVPGVREGLWQGLDLVTLVPLEPLDKPLDLGSTPHSHWRDRLTWDPLFRNERRRQEAPQYVEMMESLDRR